MENNNNESPFFSLFVTCLKTFEASTIDPHDFEDALDRLVQANNKGLLSEFLDHAENLYYNHDTDPVVAFHRAYLDIVADQGEIF